MSRTIKVNKYQLYDMVRSYAWKVKALQRLRNELEDVDCSSTAQYGIEATLPKGSGVGRPVEAELARRENKRQRIAKYEEEIQYIIEKMNTLTDDLEREMLDCLLDGHSLAAAGRHLGIPKTTAQRIYDEIVDKMAK